MIERLDHLVLTVRDVAATCDFYSRVLGMEVRTFEGARRALHFGVQKINLHPLRAVLKPKAARPTPGSADLCFLTETPLDRIIERLVAADVEVIAGPVERSGAQAAILSIYFHDPDGNLIEVANERAPGAQEGRQSGRSP